MASIDTLIEVDDNLRLASIAARKKALEQQQKLGKIPAVGTKFNNARNFANFKQSSMRNGNPQFLRGISQINLPGESSSINVPNALVQQMAADQAMAGGNRNVLDEYFGKSDPNQQYQDRTVVRGFLDRLGTNKYFQGEGAIDPKENVQNAIRSAERRKIEAAGGTNKPLTETRNAMGRVVNAGTKGEVDKINKQTQDYVNANRMDERRARSYTMDANRIAAEALDRLRKMKATSSNVSFSEKVIK